MWVSGGVTTEDELAWLDGEGAGGAVVGMALYTGVLDPARLAARWGTAGDRSVDDREQVGEET